MKNAKNAQAELQELFDLARSKGLAHTKKEFAELVGIHPANFSSFLSGYTAVTEQTMRKIKNAAIVAGVISENSRAFNRYSEITRDMKRRALGI